MDLRPFLIHYYLADDTIDITEVKTPNSGHDSFPKLLNKMKIQKNWKDVPCKFIIMIGLGILLVNLNYTLKQMEIYTTLYSENTRHCNH